MAFLIALLTIANALAGTRTRVSTKRPHLKDAVELPRLPVNKTSLFEAVPFLDPEIRSAEIMLANLTRKADQKKTKKQKSAVRKAVREAARKGLDAMVELYEKQEPLMKLRGDVLSPDDPGSKLSLFSAPHDPFDQSYKAAFAALYTAKKLKER